MASIAPATGGTWFGHPRQLARLFTTEMWERFGYYGMRTLLTLYLAQHFLFSDLTTNGLYGAFTALVYLTPLFGGLLADRYLGSKRAVKFGALLMAAGYFTLCFGGDTAKPFATINGQRYDVTVVKQGEDNRQYVTIAGEKLLIHGQNDGTIVLDRSDGSTAQTVAKQNFKSDADRSAFHVMLMLAALSAVTVGNGFFKPNISTIVGALYADGDRRRDSGFTIFYMGINIGALLAQFFLPLFAIAFGWSLGFFLAAMGMMLSWALFQFDGNRLADYGNPPVSAGPDRSTLIYAGALLAVPLTWLLFRNMLNTADTAAAAASSGGFIGYVASLPLLGKLLFFTFVAAVFGIPAWAFRNGSRAEFQMMVAAFVLIVFNVVFWTLFEQAGSSLTFFADRNTDRAIGWTQQVFKLFLDTPAIFYALAAAVSAGLGYLIYWIFSYGGTARDRRNIGIVGGSIGVLAMVGLVIAFGRLVDDSPYVMPAGQVQVFNALFIILLAPVFSGLWIWLARRGWEPGIPVKFAIALAGAGLGFLALVYGTRFAGPDFKVGLAWVALLYFIQSAAELCISPVGLSMITKLSIARIVAMMMGVWFLSIAVAQYVAGVVAQFASVETVGGEVTNLEVSLNTYVGVFTAIGWVAVGIGVLLLAISPLLKRWMHGVN